MKERIAICINSLRIGGTERVVTILMEHLKTEFDIHLILYNEEVEYKIPEDITVYPLGGPSREGGVAMLLNGLFFSYKLNRYLRQKSITTVIGFLNRGCYLTALVKKVFNYRGKVLMCQRTHQTTLVSHGSFMYKVFSNRLLKWSFAAADLLVANSSEIKEDLDKYVSRKVQVVFIPNPIDLEEIRNLADEDVNFRFSADQFHFVVLGGLRAEKNHELLLHAFAHLPAGAAKLWIIGGGKLEHRLKRLATRLNIFNSVEFCGSMTNPFPLLMKADAMVLSSRVEGFPNALLEGLACGKAIISTDCKSGPREILAPELSGKGMLEDIVPAKYGILVPVHDAVSLAKAMKEIMTNDRLRGEYSERALIRIKAFDINVLRKEFIRVFSSGTGTGI